VHGVAEDYCSQQVATDQYAHIDEAVAQRLWILSVGCVEEVQDAANHEGP
jgi:hypothetical protein